MAHSLRVRTVDVHQLAAIVRNRIDNALVLDSRSFLEYNASHVNNAINVGCAKLMKRRLQQEKLSIEDFLALNCHWDVDRSIDIVVYDQNTQDAKFLPTDSFMGVFLQKLLPVYNSVNILRGGFLEFQAAYPNLCENERAKFAPLTSLSQPCLPVTNHGPTKILPFLYLGSQHDALSKDILQHHNISYQLNVSTSCPKPEFIQESHFMRIPVIDNYSEKLLPHFAKAFQFLDKVKESGGCVLVHCLAGISRSATVAIAYVMKSLRMTSDEAYRYVKAKRTTISPNFNFLGQLLEYEKQLQRDSILKMKSESPSTPLFSSSNSLCSQTHENSYQSIQDTALCSTPMLFSDSYCLNMAEAKRLPYRRSPEVKECLMTFEQTVSKNLGSIPCKQAATLNIKCLPVSSLKELNFTPCQTSRCRSFASKEPQRSPIKSASFAGSKRTDFGLNECSLSPSFPSPGSVKSFEFSSKSYNRSDSTSTSGLGSEGSDYADSWNELTSSCERETDILMDDDYSTVPTEEDEMRKNKILGFDDSFEDSVSFYPKYQNQYLDFGRHVQQQIECSQAVPTKSENPDSKYEDLPKSPPLYTSTNPDTSRSHLLYRARSCPGMITSETVTPHYEPCLNVKLRKATTTKLRDECRNRYSCSSIDYMDYSHSSILSQDSCPETLHMASSSERSRVSSSHCNYRHSMIQVS